MPLAESIPLLKESVEDTIKFKALLFHFWMKYNHPQVSNEIDVVKFYDEFEKLYKEMRAEKPTEDRPY